MEDAVVLEKKMQMLANDCPFTIHLIGTYQDDLNVYLLEEPGMGIFQV